MPRKRISGEKLPKYVYLSKGRYVLKRYLGVREGRPRFEPEVRLCPGNVTTAQVWAAYERHVHDPDHLRSLRHLMGKFAESDQFARFSESTQKDYGRYQQRIGDFKLRGGGTFGDVPYDQITTGTLRKFLDARSKNARVAGNREISYLVSVFAWAVERDMMLTNPARGVKKNSEKARTRLVTPEEFWAVYDQAADPLKVAMILAVGLRARPIETIELRWADVSDIAIRLKRRKGSKTQDILITPFIRQGLDLAKKSKVRGLYVVQKSDGQPYKPDGFRNLWRKCWAKVDGIERFTFHDLKACGVSFFDGDKGKASGHWSERMTRVYNRTIEAVAGTDIKRAGGDDA